MDRTPTLRQTRQYGLSAPCAWGHSVNRDFKHGAMLRVYEGTENNSSQQPLENHASNCKDSSALLGQICTDCPTHESTSSWNSEEAGQGDTLQELVPVLV